MIVGITNTTNGAKPGKDVVVTVKASIDKGEWIPGHINNAKTIYCRFHVA